MRTNGFKRPNANDVFNRLDELEDDPPETEITTNTPEVDPTAEADEAAAHGAGETAADAAPISRRRRLLRRVAAAATALVFVAALAATAYLGWQLKQRNDAAAAGRAALAVAQSYAVTLTSVDTNNIDQNFNQVLNGATGEFKDMYSQSAAQLRQVLIDNKAMSKGTVVDAAIKSATTTKVEVLLFIDQSISNVVNPQPRIDRSRVAMTMELVDNHWLASKVDIK
jgi:Mce-associated membrane protein